ESVSPGSVHSVRSGDVIPIRRGLRWWRSAAAGVMVAASFALGWLSHSSASRDGDGSSHLIAAAPTAVQSDVDSTSEPVAAASAGSSEPSQPNGRFAARQSLSTPDELVRTVAQVRIGPEGTGATVPILTGPGINGDWLKAQPPPLSEHEQVALQRLGYQV